MNDNIKGGPKWLLMLSQGIALLVVLSLVVTGIGLYSLNKKINHATLLAQAASHDDLTAMSLMLNAGYDPDAKGRKSDSPLLWASRKGNTRALQLLLSYHADVRGDEGIRCLDAAAQFGHVDVVQELLAHGANPKGNPAHVTSTPLVMAQKNPDMASREKIIVLLKKR